MFADLIIPVPLQKLFTYEVPQSMASLVKRGCRVLVQFGKKKYYAGIVMRVHNEKPDYETKALCEIVDTEPIVTEEQMETWQWIADYYICTQGEVMKAAMPQGLKLESESKLMYNALFEEEEALTQRQKEVLDFIREKKICTISDVANHLNGVNPVSHIRALIDAEAIYISEELRDAYKPKMVTTYKMGDEMRSEDDVLAQLDPLGKKAPKQLESLMGFIQLAGGLARATEGVMLRREQLSGDERISMTAIEGLVQKGILQRQKTEVSRLERYTKTLEPPHTLTAPQAKALAEIRESAKTGRPTLLYGVTGCGKTEIYIHLMEETLRQGHNVLYLLPEIALTTQITNRLRRHFGDQMAVYHSKFSDAERVEVWHKLLSSAPPRIILGVRSSILLPLRDVRLIIVDEEHESSYKQYDPSPRYNARDMAVVLAMQINARLKEGDARCRIILGSATPSLESWNNATSGRYGLVRLTERHAGLELPTVETINMTEARHQKMVHGIFSFRLKEVIERALEKKEQVILFQNRRGFSPVVECKQCAWVPKCVNCDVSLTYHKSLGQLVCHYCGYAEAVPQVCPACGTPTLRTQGFGTEKIEEECKALFPAARVARMDLDTAKSRKAFEAIISQFGAREYDILIGTQMVTKGLDFEGVSTVGVMNADALLNRPDFRADERAYQLMAQVSGRAGRKETQGKVFIQVNKTEHPVIAAVAKNDFEGNAERLLAERRAYQFPPFYRMISLVVKNKDLSIDLDAALVLAQMLRDKFGNIVTGPLKPVVARVSQFYMQEISLKVSKASSPTQVKALMMNEINMLLADQRFRGTIVRIDVDPY